MGAVPKKEGRNQGAYAVRHRDPGPNLLPHHSRESDCNIVNGWYGPAERYLDLLSHSLFYRKEAQRRKVMIRNEAAVNSDPVYAYVRSVRFKDDFITGYQGLDIMMAILYNQNKDNFMAAEYYTVWQRLKQREGAE